MRLFILALSISLSLSILPSISSSSSIQFSIDGKVLELDESNFEAAISYFDYVFVDFYAPWCGHCKRLSPELDKAASILAGLKDPIVIAKVNADKYTHLATKYEIDGFPTLKIFMHGVPTEYYGPRKADSLVRYLKKFVAQDVAILTSDSDISDFVESAGTDFPIYIGFGLNESMISNLAIKYKKKAWFSVAKDFSEDAMLLYDFDKVPAFASFHPNYNEKSIFYGPFEDKRSLSGSGAGPNAVAASQFVRAEMLPSGYLIRPCEGGGSIIHIVDHLNLEAWSVPEVLRPLYESSKVVAQKMTIAALRYIRQIAQEASGEVVYGLGRQPAVLRTFSQRLSRGFNDAVNGFNDGGWSIVNCDGAEDVMVAVNSTKNLGATSSHSNSLSLLGGILCAKASMLLENVPPAVLVRFLREHRSEWADFNVDAYSAAALKASSFAYPGMRPTRFTGSQIIMPLGHTIEHEQMLEVIRLEGHSLAQEDAFMSRDIHLLQICSGIEENAVGACAELVFAPIDEMFPDDAPLLPSGFRIIPLDSKSSDTQDTLTANRTLDLTSSFEVGPATNQVSGDTSSCYNARSVLTIAFQFPFENNLQDNIAAMARQYVRSVISSVQRVAMAISPSGLSPTVGPKLSPGSPEALTLAHWICQSYSFHLGTELLRSDSVGGESLLKHLWHHPDAILCCSLKSLPVFIFANQAGLDMLETTLVALQDITLDKIFDESGRKALYSDFAKIMQQGFACLPVGICMSTMGRHVSYEQAIAWKVLAAEENTVHCLAFSFVNWSFV